MFREFTSERLRKRFLLSILFVLAAAGPPCVAQETIPQAVLFKRYDRGGSQNRIVEDTFTLKLDVKPEQKFTIALRACSKDPLPFALFTAYPEPLFIGEWLISGYGYSTERIVYLRSEDCLGKDPARGITEIWTMSEGASFPSHIEKLVSTDAQRVRLGKRPASMEIGVRDYRIALDNLIKELQHDPTARGVVVGYFMKRPGGPTLRRRIREIKRTLERSGLAPERYLVYTDYVYGEVPENAPEPQYPEVYIIKKAN